MTVREILQTTRERLQKAGIEDFEYESFLLLDWKLHVDRADFYMDPEKEVSEEAWGALDEVLLKREERIPLQYLMRECEFMGYPFYVDDRVLIPRQDTECLVELALKQMRADAAEKAEGSLPGKEAETAKANLPGKEAEAAKASLPGKERAAGAPLVLDLCTGSGCIGISVAKLYPEAKVTLADISGDALAVAGKNAGLLGADVRLVESDLFERFEPETEGEDHIDKFDYILSNPPYIPSEVIGGLMPEVRDHEPRLALDGEADGLAFYRKIVQKAGAHLNPGGRIFFEIGAEQGEDLLKIFLENGFSDGKIHKDLAGLDRIAAAKWT